MNSREKNFQAMKRITEKNPESIKVQAGCTLDGKSPVEQTLLRIGDILASIAVERTRQELKWGVQGLPDRDGTDYDVEDAHEIAQSFKDSPNGSWQHVLLEEVYEALAETDPDKIAEELIQCAAVCISWVENLASRK